MTSSHTELTQLKEIIALIPGNVYWKDRDGRYLGCNENVVKILKLNSAQDIIGKHNRDILDKELAALADEIDNQVIEHNRKVTTEEIGLNIHGEKAIYFTTKIPLHDETGSVNGILGISIDISENKMKEASLEEAYRELDRINVGLKLVAASIAHELRTPLAAISSASTGFIKYLPQLVATYQIAKDNNLNIPFIPSYKLNLLNSINNSIHQEISAANLVINMLLTKIYQSEVTENQLSENSISDCINDSLKRYPLSKDERLLIHWQSDNDFTFTGYPILIIHVFFNLLKNALTYIKSTDKGEINIWLERGQQYNTVYFKDSGKGISADILPFIFDRFYTKTPGGAGIGLAFCKETMVNIGGNIMCTSIEGEFTLFQLIFPALP